MKRTINISDFAIICTKSEIIEVCIKMHLKIVKKIHFPSFLQSCFPLTQMLLSYWHFQI